MARLLGLSGALFTLLYASTFAVADDSEQLLEAARKGDLAGAKRLLDKGVDVNAKTAYGMTALGFAAERGHTDIVKLLLERKADVDAQDTFYKSTPLSWALMSNRTDVVGLLLKAGAKGEVGVLNAAVSQKNAALLKAALDSGRIKQEALDAALGKTPADQQELVELLKKAGAKVQPAAAAAKPATPTKPMTGDTKPAEAAKPPAVPVELNGVVDRVKPWPSFRGPGATGAADGQFPPTAWDAATGRHLRWKAPIPGLGLSCPVVTGDRLFLTTAIPDGNARPALRTGQYGDVDPVKETEPHTWKVFCLDTTDGHLLWERTACTGVPRVKRHPKSSHANSTPATDGKRVVACFGSEGLYCYTLDGDLRWRKELGKLSSGWFFHPDYEWGFGSSPIIYRDLVIVQCDIGKDSFIAAYHLDDGHLVWQTPRDEVPSWGTPTVIEPASGQPELVTLATAFARGYDPLTGKELWRLGKFSEITVPTPFFAQGLIFLASGYRPIQPVYAVRPGARGDISLKEGEESNAHVAWSKQRGGPYLPTPIAYGEHLYCCSNGGILTCFEAKTGKQMYQERLGGTSGYTAAPVAADGRLYFTGEDGDVRVVKAGPTFELLAINQLGEACLATPAISDGTIFIRGREHLFAFSRGASAGRDVLDH
jgi:outer membrane protein assembly factor BamB